MDLMKAQYNQTETNANTRPNILPKTSPKDMGQAVLHQFEHGHEILDDEEHGTQSKHP